VCAAAALAALLDCDLGELNPADPGDSLGEVKTVGLGKRRPRRQEEGDIRLRHSATVRGGKLRANKESPWPWWTTRFT
jgi:hypothetical protein